jgi:hypothetical protein
MKKEVMAVTSKPGGASVPASRASNLNTGIRFSVRGARLYEPQQLCDAKVGKVLFDHRNSKLLRVKDPRSGLTRAFRFASFATFCGHPIAIRNSESGAGSPGWNRILADEAIGHPKLLGRFCFPPESHRPDEIYTCPAGEQPQPKYYWRRLTLV